MKTVTSVFTAALSFAALASTASAMPHVTTFDGLSAPTITAKLNPATSGAGFARAAAGNAKGTHAPDTTPPIFGVLDTTPPTFGVSDTSPPTFGVSDQMPQVQTTFKLASQSADIAVEKAMNSGSSDENIAAAACTTPVNNALIAVVIIAAVDADNCPKPQAATAIEYGLIAALIGGGPDATDTTTTGEAEPAAATAIEYGLIAALIGGGPDATDTTTTGEADRDREYGLIAALTSNGPDAYRGSS